MPSRFKDELDRTRRITGDKTFDVKNAWIPEPSQWIWHLPQLFRKYYFDEVLGFQGCDRFNKYHRAVINVTVPKGGRRSAYESDLRRRVENVCRRRGTEEIITVLTGIAVATITICTIPALSIWEFQLSVASLLTLLIAFAVVVTLTATEIGIDTITDFKSNYRLIPEIIYIASGIWCFRQILDYSTEHKLRSIPSWEAGILTGISALGLFGILVLIISFLRTISARRYSTSHFDDSIIAYWLLVHHYCTIHKTSWAQPAQQKSVAFCISRASEGVNRWLPRWLHTMTGQRARGRRDHKILAIRISEAMSIHSNDMLQKDGRKRLTTTANYYIGQIHQSAWLDLPQQDPPKATKGALQRFMRPLLASLLPAVLMLALSLSGKVPSGAESYGWLLAIGWFALYIASWLDPDFGDRLKAMSSVVSLIRNRTDEDERG